MLMDVASGAIIGFMLGMAWARRKYDRDYDYAVTGIQQAFALLEAVIQRQRLMLQVMAMQENRAHIGTCAECGAQTVAALTPFIGAGSQN